MKFSNPEVQEIYDRVMRGEDKPPPTPKPKVVKPKKKPGQGKGPRPRARQVDYGYIARLYKDNNLTVREVADKVRVSTSTVITALKAEKVYEPGRDKGRNRAGPPRQDECQRGHSMDDAYIYNTPRGPQRQCRVCTQERQRARHLGLTPEQREERRARARTNDRKRREKKNG